MPRPKLTADEFAAIAAIAKARAPRLRMEEGEVLSVAMIGALEKLPKYKKGSVPRLNFLTQRANWAINEHHRRECRQAFGATKREVNGLLKSDKGAVKTPALNRLVRAILREQSYSAEHADPAYFDRAGQVSRVLAALDEIPPREAQAMSLLYLGELPAADIAAVMKIDQRSVQRLARDGVQRVRLLLTGAM
jgi:RNA polymerase sigma factor (sigma-70 family)